MGSEKPQTKKPINLKQAIRNWLMILGLLAFALITLLPQLSDFRKTLWYWLITAVVMSLFLAFAVFFRKGHGKPSVSDIVIYSLTVLAFFLNPFYPTVRVRMAVASIFDLVLLLAALILYFTKRKWATTPAICGVSSLVVVILLEMRIQAIDNALHYWVVSLLIALLLTAGFVAILIVKPATFTELENSPSKAKTTLKVIFSFTLFLAAFGLVYFSATAWNYAFDRSPVVEEAFTITKKDLRKSVYSPTRYEFTLQNGDTEVTLEVSSDDYSSYSEGDTYEVSINQGAFGVAYYSTLD